MKKLIEYFEKIYYINLDRDYQRQVYVIEQFKNSQLLPYLERFEAIDGKDINIDTIDSSIITNNARKDILANKQRIFGVSLTFGALGCALSHKIIYEQCSKSIKPYLIFEDDIIIDSNFDAQLEILLNECEQYQDIDILYLGFHNIPHAKKIIINDVISKPDGLVCGTYGYVVWPKAAQKILDIIFPLNIQIDSSLSNNRKHFNVYCSTNDIIKMTREFKSNTQQDFSCQNIYRQSDDNWHKLFK